MKTIKKVSVTPVAENTGTIIDSFSTTDDKHTNAPSLNAVESYVSDNTPNLSVLNGTAQFDGTTLYKSISYPTGFNQTNTAVLGVTIQNESPNSLYKVRLDEGDLKIVQNTANAVIVTYKIVLMKI